MNGQLTLFQEQLLDKYANSPILTCGGWGDTIPEWLKEAIKKARINQKDKELATNEDTLAYLMCASLSMPLDADFANIYLYLSNKVMTEHNRLPDGEIFNALNTKPIELNPDELNQLDRLRRDIMRKLKQLSKGGI